MLSGSRSFHWEFQSQNQYTFYTFTEWDIRLINRIRSKTRRRKRKKIETMVHKIFWVKPFFVQHIFYVRYTTSIQMNLLLYKFSQIVKLVIILESIISIEKRVFIKKRRRKMSDSIGKSKINYHHQMCPNDLFIFLLLSFECIFII